jgi:hypothetical protein
VTAFGELLTFSFASSFNSIVGLSSLPLGMTRGERISYAKRLINN